MLTTLIYITVTSLIISCASLFVAQLIARRTVQIASDDLNARIVSLLADSLAMNWSTNSAIENRTRDLLDTCPDDELEVSQLELLEWLLEISKWPELEDSYEEEISDHSNVNDLPPPSEKPVKLVAVSNEQMDWDETKSFLSDHGEGDVLEEVDEIHNLSTELEHGEDADRRANAAIKLGQLGDVSSVPYLVRALRNDEAGQVQTFSAVALGMIGSNEAVSPLIDVIKIQIASRIDISHDASYGGFRLVRALQREIDPEPEAWLGQEPIAAQIWALGRIGSPRACDALVERLADPDPGIRWFAGWALGKIGIERVVPALTRLIDDPVDDVRWVAIWALGRMNSTRAVDQLIACTADANPSLRRIAIWALGRGGDPRGREVVLESLTDQERGVRQVASWALSRIEPELSQSA